MHKWIVHGTLLAGLCLLLTTSFAQDDCPGPCGGVWQTDTVLQNNGARVGTWTADQASVATPAEQTANWMNNGTSGQENLQVKVDDPLPFAGGNPDNGLASISKSNDSFKQLVIRWDPGQSDHANCKHGRPDGGKPPVYRDPPTNKVLDNGLASWGGGGGVIARCGGTADNGRITAGVSSAGATATLTFSGLESTKCSASVTGSRTEGANPTTGTITISPTNPGVALTFIINNDVWTSGNQTATASVSGPSPNASPALNSPADIVGAFIKAQGQVTASASIDKGAINANAFAITQITSLQLTGSGGVHSTCCAMKNHNDHSTGTDGNTTGP